MSNPNTSNAILSRWIPALPAPELDCGRCSRAERAPNLGAQERWRTYKCCTFQPFVANFYLGALLASGRDPLVVDLRRASLQPIGVVATANFRREHQLIPEDQHGEEQRCTYYRMSDGRCQIWDYRPGECAHYFCSGIAVEAFQLRSEQAFALEAAAAQMALATLGFSPAQIRGQLQCLNEPTADMSSWSAERAREHYLACWAWFEKCDPAAVRGWVDFDNSPGAK